ITTLLIREPPHKTQATTLQLEDQLVHQFTDNIPVLKTGEKIASWFLTAVVSPFVDFFKRNGNRALLILLLIGCYRITDITMAVMANPFYLDLGFSKIEIANITKLFGFVLTIIGAASGGILVMRYGIMRIMLLGLIMVISSNLMFAWLAQHGRDISALAVVISADSFAGGIASAVFIAYLSSLTNTAYTATQYALFSSLMTLFPKIIAGFSGVVVEQSGYEMFYIYSSLLSIPALLIIIYMLKNPQSSAD
ncbi:MAG TPA: MFS transporter, partial [Gammaproteobacteria bacterium]|nr:MFS transporter [Gammaproteobacteria bacterium]